MKDFQQHISFENSSNPNIEERAINYFTLYGFKFQKKSDNEFLFYKKATFLEGWKFNPLHWESTIEISINNKTVELNYQVIGLYVTPLAFSNLYNTFTKNFKKYCTQNMSFETKNNTEIKSVKRKLYCFYLILLLGVLVGVLVAKLTFSFFESRFLEILLIIVIASISEKQLNNYLSRKHALK